MLNARKNAYANKCIMGMRSKESVFVCVVGWCGVPFCVSKGKKVKANALEDRVYIFENSNSFILINVLEWNVRAVAIFTARIKDIYTAKHRTHLLL